MVDYSGMYCTTARLWIRNKMVKDKASQDKEQRQGKKRKEYVHSIYGNDRQKGHEVSTFPRVLSTSTVGDTTDVGAVAANMSSLLRR